MLYPLFRIKCDKCPKRFETDDQLITHVQSSHEKVARHSCEVCGAHYVTKQGLNFHRRKAHLGYVLPLKYECVSCDKKFTVTNKSKFIKLIYNVLNRF